MSLFENQKQKYVVLARRYRPKDFSHLRGQDVLVQTISNAIKQNKIPHAFLLTGIRGVGKTTTARILAKTVNCKNLQFENTIVMPCNECQSCLSFMQDKNPDIIEIDAASKTGVSDIREIIENARYLPQMSNYKIYVIDEVHMLSINAFNALLKTLEEPPSHVIFVFATTESRKIPITILSRCQRFDLRRLSHIEIVNHLQDIIKKEGINAELRALEIIAKCSEGSVRDSLSLLDQSIMYSKENIVTTEVVESILGIGDQSVVLDIFESIVTGKLKDSISILQKMYFKGLDLQLIVSDLMNLTNNIIKLQNNIAIDEYLYVENDVQRLKNIASKIKASYLVILWQIMSNSLQEIQHSFNILSSAEMLLIKLSYVKDGTYSYEVSNQDPAPKKEIDIDLNEKSVIKSNVEIVKINNFPELVKLFYDRKEMILYHHLYEDVRLVKFEPRILKLNLSSHAPSNLPSLLSKCLDEWTGQKWVISISHEEGDLTLKSQDDYKTNSEKKEILEEDIVKEALQIFDGAKVTSVHKGTPK